MEQAVDTVQERDNQIPLFQNALIQQKVSNPILEEDQNNLIIKDNTFNFHKLKEM